MAERVEPFRGKFERKAGVLLEYQASAHRRQGSISVTITLVADLGTDIPFPMAVEVNEAFGDQRQEDIFFLNPQGHCIEHTWQGWSGSEISPDPIRNRSLQRLRTLKNRILGDTELPENMRTRLELAFGMTNN